jgi:sulfhydrogenase subunit beta (sulfur reductase)
VAFFALDTKNLDKFIAAMQKQARVLAPVFSDENGVVLSEPAHGASIRLDFINYKLPLKREFFPQCEVLSRFDINGVKEEPVSDKPVIFFGVRPCDARSLLMLDKVLIDGRHNDPYYQKRRDNAIVISLACAEPGEACFCTSMGGGPAIKEGADIIAFPLNQSLLFESVSKKGEELLKKNAKLFREPSSKEQNERKKLESSSWNPGVKASGAKAGLAAKNDPKYWNNLAESCLSCGACTYLCPTCHCFDLFDEKQGDTGTKLRVHDACMFAGFVREASGHNPRSSKGDRMRQRVMHKFSYAPENYGIDFCVGCGRCVASCPSNIDIRETLAEVSA